MNETDLYYQLRRKIWGRYTRIENAISSGLFDVNALYPEGREFWLELKIQHSNKIQLEPTQRVWAIKRFQFDAKNLYFIVDGFGVKLYLAEEILRQPYEVKNTKLQYDLTNCKHAASGWHQLRDYLYFNER